MSHEIPKPNQELFKRHVAGDIATGEIFPRASEVDVPEAETEPTIETFKFGRATVEFIHPEKGFGFARIETPGGTKPVFFHKDGYNNYELTVHSTPGVPLFSGQDKEETPPLRRGDVIALGAVTPGRNGKRDSVGHWTTGDRADYLEQKLEERARKWPVGVYVYSEVRNGTGRFNIRSYSTHEFGRVWSAFDFVVPTLWFVVEQPGEFPHGGPRAYYGTEEFDQSPPSSLRPWPAGMKRIVQGAEYVRDVLPRERHLVSPHNYEFIATLPAIENYEAYQSESHQLVTYDQISEGEMREQFAVMEASYARMALESKLADLQHLTPDTLPVLNMEHIRGRVSEIVMRAVKANELSETEKADIEQLRTLEEHLGEELVRDIQEKSPYTIELGGVALSGIRYSRGKPYMYVEPDELTEDQYAALADHDSAPVLSDGRVVDDITYMGRRFDAKKELLDRYDSKEEKRLQELWCDGERKSNRHIYPYEEVEVARGVYQVELGHTTHFQYPILGYSVDRSLLTGAGPGIWDRLRCPNQAAAFYMAKELENNPRAFFSRRC